mmetsp:Transcript_10632/g.25996  ORF Transcript_10632/g.25996 Transcript_10632/m.25996 type:complete len:202 (+) Transcript_10632:724-1329(+)
MNPGSPSPNPPRAARAAFGRVFSGPPPASPRQSPLRFLPERRGSPETPSRWRGRSARSRRRRAGFGRPPRDRSAPSCCRTAGRGTLAAQRPQTRRRQAKRRRRPLPPRRSFPRLGSVAPRSLLSSTRCAPTPDPDRQSRINTAPASRLCRFSPGRSGRTYQCPTARSAAPNLATPRGALCTQTYFQRLFQHHPGTTSFCRL